MSRTDCQRGISLIEVIIFIVIVGVSLAGVLSIFIRTTSSSANPVLNKQAIAVAESLMEEIAATPYSCPPAATCNAVTTTNRTQTHKIADYDGFTMIGIAALDGSPIPRLSGYTARVKVASEPLNTANGNRVTVTVETGVGSVSLSGWRGSY